MNTHDILAQLTADGIRLEVDGGTLSAGPRGALTDEHRRLIRQHKPELMALLSEPRRLWLVTLPGGERLSVSFCPPAGMAEVRAAYPTAQGIEPDLRRPEPSSPKPTPEQERTVRCWLDQIGEDDPELIAETVERIRTDALAFSFFLRRAMEPVDQAASAAPFLQKTGD